MIAACFLVCCGLVITGPLSNGCIARNPNRLRSDAASAAADRAFAGDLAEARDALLRWWVAAEESLHRKTGYGFDDEHV